MSEPLSESVSDTEHAPESLTVDEGGTPSDLEPHEADADAGEAPEDVVDTDEADESEAGTSLADRLAGG